MQCMKRQATNNEIKSLSCKQRRFMDLRCNLWTPKYFLIKLNNKQNEIWDFISTASLIVFDVCIWYSARWTVRFIVLYMLYGVVWCCYDISSVFFFSLPHRFSSYFILVALNAEINQIGISHRLCFYFVRRQNVRDAWKNER